MIQKDCCAKESRQALLHREKIYAAERSRLEGQPVYTSKELDEKMEPLFAHQKENQ